MKGNQYQRHQNKKDQLLVALIGHINYLLTTGVRHIKIQLNGIQFNPC